MHPVTTLAPVTTPTTLTPRRWPAVAGVHLEGITWDGAGDGRLLLVDLTPGLVHLVPVRSDGAPGDARRLDLPAPVTAVHPTTDPRTLLVADGEGMALVRQPAAPGGAPVTERLAAPLAGRPGIRMNDGGVDPAGRYFAGSMAYDTTPGAACLYRLDPDRSLHTVLTGVTVSNGIDWSPDGTLCYFADTPLDRVDVFDHDPATGRLARRRPFVDTTRLPGMPDGLTVDADGCVWVAFWGGAQVCCFAPDGTLLATVPLPVSQVTSCAFGGPGLDLLFITTSTEHLDEAARAAQPDAGALFVVETGRRGRAATPFPVPAEERS